VIRVWRRFAAYPEALGRSLGISSRSLTRSGWLGLAWLGLFVYCE